MKTEDRSLTTGMIAALLTPVFMGMAPIFAKVTLGAGLDAFTMAAYRTLAAALFLWVLYLLFFRKYTFIFAAGLLGTFTVGALNGLGSVLFYNGLNLLNDASLAQVLFMTYVIFSMVLTRIYGGVVSPLSVLRGIMALIAVLLLTTDIGTARTAQHWYGVGLALGGALLYALHVFVSQRIMYEMPAPTMALYSLSFMGLTVLAVRLIFGAFMDLPWVPTETIGWWSLAGMMIVTALSRVTLFAGVRNLGGLQTMLLNAAELGVTLLLGFFLLGERLTGQQWIGVVILLASVFLSTVDTGIRDDVYKPLPKPRPLAGLPRPLLPNRFSIVTRVFRRRPIDIEDDE